MCVVQFLSVCYCFMQCVMLVQFLFVYFIGGQWWLNNYQIHTQTSFFYSRIQLFSVIHCCYYCWYCASCLVQKHFGKLKFTIQHFHSIFVVFRLWEKSAFFSLNTRTIYPFILNSLWICLESQRDRNESSPDKDGPVSRADQMCPLCQVMPSRFLIWNYISIVSIPSNVLS